MRLIDADALIKFLGTPEDWRDEAINKIISNYPTVDAVPVVRGEWEIAIGYDPNKKVQCQNCYKMAYEPTPYCPNCGAKMEYKPCG